MLNGTNLTLNSVFGSGLYRVRYIPGHWKINKTLALLLLIGGCSACADPEGGQGVRTPPLEIFNNIGFFSNSVPDLLKIVKLPSQLSIFWP